MDILYFIPPAQTGISGSTLPVKICVTNMKLDLIELLILMLLELVDCHFYDAELRIL